MAALKKIPVYLFLIPIFFCLHGTVENFGSLTFREVFIPGVYILAAISVLFGLIWLVCREVILAALITAFISLWYFFFGALQDSLKSVQIFHPLKSFTVLVPTLLIVSAAWVFFLIRKPFLRTKINLYVNILLIIYCVTDLAFLGYKVATPAKELPQIQFNSATVTEKPDVYFLLYDEYAGYRSLQDSFSFKNDAFYNTLRADSFVIIPTFANYHYTSFCMSSILNMTYLPVLAEPEVVTQKNVQQRCIEIKNAIVFRFFKNMGYNVQGYSVFDVLQNKSFGGNTFLKGHSYILTEKIFHNRIIKYFSWSFPKPLADMSFMQEFEPGDLLTYNERVTDSLIHFLKKKAERPKFAYAHFLLPHWPFLYDSLGRGVSPNGPSLSREEAYLSYLKYANTKISALISTIITTDKNAIIILMSDHGYRDVDFTHGAKPAYFDNICAIRNPGKKTLPYSDSHSTVNFFRYFFNENFGQRLTYLKDTTFNLREKQ